MCNGKLKHCDLKENYGEQGYSHEEVCRNCISSRNNSIKVFNELAQKEKIKVNIKFINENPNPAHAGIDSNSNKELVLDRPYYLSELCSYYRLDELSITRVIKNSNKKFLKLNSQSKELMEFFENNIEIGPYVNCLGVVFNGRLSPHSDFIRWGGIKDFNIIVHERGRVDGIYNIRLNRSALDQYEYNYFRREYLKIWKPELYPWIMDKLQKEYLEKGNTTSRFWKESQNKKYEKIEVKNSICGELSIVVFMSSTDEAFDDNGTLLLELQLKFIEALVYLKKYLSLKIKIKPHPDTISRIDLTCQHLIVNKLLEIDSEVEILWPESKETVKDICGGADVVFVPHSSVGIELAYNSIGFISFQDSPFADFADAKLNVGEITDLECLKILIIQYVENKQVIRDRDYVDKSIDKHLLTWLMWDAIFSGDKEYINKRVDKALNRISKKTLRGIGLMAKNDKLDLASFRHALINQAKLIEVYLNAYQTLRNTYDGLNNNSVQSQVIKIVDKEDGKKTITRTSKITKVKDYAVSKTNTKKGILIFGKLFFNIGEYKVIKNKVNLLPEGVQKFAETGLVLINGILRIDDTITRLVGWEVPKKAERSNELKMDYQLPYQSEMCFSASECIMNRVIDEYVDVNKYKKIKVNEKELLTSYLKAANIVYMKYREPLVMCSVKSGYSKRLKKQ